MRGPGLRALLVVSIAASVGVGAAVAARTCTSRPPVHVLLLDTPPATPVSAEAEIAGGVARPGLYPLVPGERLDALIAAAGGLSTNADSSRVNLAERVYDGERIDVPLIDAARSGTAGSPPAELVRINHASREELLTLPGVTVSQAAAIQSSIRAQGSIRSLDELIRRRLASQAQAQQIDALVDWAP